jgi:hypothetical protein
MFCKISTVVWFALLFTIDRLLLKSRSFSPVVVAAGPTHSDEVPAATSSVVLVEPSSDVVCTCNSLFEILLAFDVP